MAEPILRACPNCGGTDRYKDGKCKACVIARVKDYARRNQAARKEYIRQWRLSKIDEVRADDKKRAAEYRAAHPERRREINKAYRERNIEKARAASKAWKAANKEKVTEFAAQRRARIVGAGGRLPRGTIKRLMELQKNKCACCHKGISKDRHLDHIIPLSKGGKHEFTNVQLLCPQCNLSKSAKHPVDFMQQRGMLL